MLNILKNLSLDLIGNISADWSDVMKQATEFIAAYYAWPATR
jgi:hypothetical protein